jgi:type IV pilus assembly protein PilN
MARINLLPWREEQRQERQRQFMLSVLFTVILGVILVFAVGLVFDQRIAHQNARNQVIQEHIGRLQARINRIRELEQTRTRLLSRKRVIEDLQASRSLTVEMLDQLAKSIPVGLTLDSISQQGTAVRLTGFSQSNARVSAYLQSLQENPLFRDPELSVVRTAQRPPNAVEPYEFIINVKLRPTKNSDEEMGYDTEETGGQADA